MDEMPEGLNDEQLARWRELEPELEAAFEEWIQKRRLPWEAVLAGVVRTFVARDHVANALALAECDIELVRENIVDDKRVVVRLLCPPSAWDGIRADLYEGELFTAFEMNLPPEVFLADLVIRAKVEPVAKDWRQQVRAGLEGSASNQGVPIGTSPIATYNGLNYRSRTEITLAQELESRSLLFFPNCRASKGRTVREPDFLVVYKGRVGILEVDGPTHRGKAADDHMRDLFFQQAGILLVKHFNWEDVRDNPKLVVDTFLGLLADSGR